MKSHWCAPPAPLATDAMPSWLAWHGGEWSSYTLGYLPLFAYTSGPTSVAPCPRPNTIVTLNLQHTCGTTPNKIKTNKQKKNTISCTIFEGHKRPHLYFVHIHSQWIKQCMGRKLLDLGQSQINTRLPRIWLASQRLFFLVTNRKCKWLLSNCL